MNKTKFLTDVEITIKLSIESEISDEELQDIRELSSKHHVSFHYTGFYGEGKRHLAALKALGNVKCLDYCQQDSNTVNLDIKLGETKELK
jgi:hypothetical protein